MKNLFVAMFGAVLLLLSGVAAAQGANMMNGGGWGGRWMGGYVGMWLPILLAVVVVGLVAWIVKRK